MHKQSVGKCVQNTKNSVGKYVRLCINARYRANYRYGKKIPSNQRHKIRRLQYRQKQRFTDIANVYGIFAKRGLIVGIVTVFGEFYNSNKRKKTKGRTCCVPYIFNNQLSYFFLVLTFLPLLVGPWYFWSVAPELPFTLVLPLFVFSLAFSLF